MAPHYRGGDAVVGIEAFKGGATVYKVEKRLDGASGMVDSTVVLVTREPQVPEKPKVAGGSFSAVKFGYDPE